MKKWLLLALLLSGCFFQEQNSQGSKWVDELDLDIRNRTELVQIEDLSVSASTLKEYGLISGRADDTVMYQAEFGVTRTLTGRLLLGAKEFGNETFDNELFLDFDVSDSVYGLAKREGLYYSKPDSTDLNPDYDTLVITPEELDANLQLNLATIYYESDLAESAVTPDSVEFEVKWYVSKWAKLESDLNDSLVVRKDSVGLNYDYWAKVVQEDTTANFTGTFKATGVLKEIADSTGSVSRTYYEISFNDELDSLLIDNRDFFSSLSFRIKALGLTEPLNIAAPDVSSQRPMIELNGSVKQAVFSAYQASSESDENAVYAGIADTLTLVPDYKQIADALQKAGFEAMSNNQEVIISAVLKLELPDTYSYESSLGHGSWLRLYSFADSNKYREETKVAEYQIPALDSILKTDNATYWISNDKENTELSWMVGYGMRTWFNYSIDDESEQSFKLVLLQGIEEGDALSVTEYDGFNRMAKLDLVDLSQLKWSLDLVVLSPGEEL